jgi:D-arabinose 1-dehydrogenase-like Zn-dependent alcohol dehydrogenase
MKALVVPGVNQEWQVRETPTPSPAPGEVLVRVRASSICHNDIALTRGVFPFPQLNPVITGHESAGEVVEVGAGVITRQPGDRVGITWVQATCGRCDYCRRNLPLSGQSGMSCRSSVMTGLTAQGGHAEYVAVRAESTVLLPEGLSYELASPVLCAGYTAWGALRAADPKPHERVAVLGIGGLGHMAVQFASACGFETVAITRSPDKRELATQLGARHVVANGAELRDIGGADVILATGISHPAAEEALQGLRHNGRLMLATIDPAHPFTIPAVSGFWAKRLEVRGATHHGLRYLTEALELVARGVVTPIVEVFPLAQGPLARQRAERGEVRFRAVIQY